MKKILIISILTILVASFVYFIFDSFQTEIVRAGSEHNVSGWAWSSNIGWISFNNTTGGGTTNYGVNIGADGKFSGYAWSENIGWIDFAPTGPYPAAPDYSAKVDLVTGQVSGWARALAFGDGWDGWIKLRDTNYGVSINPSNGEFSGWAWSDMVIGWISFNCSNQGVCGTSDYKVITSFSFNQPPNKPSNLYETWSHCSVQKLSIPIFHWTYSDPDGDPQAASHLKIYGETTLDTGEISCPSTCLSYTPLPGWIRDNLNWNKTYSWQVKVKDDQGNWSEWSDLNYFTMPVHAYPWVDFDWSPERPSVNEVVQFIDQSEVYGGAIKFSWAWTFQHGNPPDSNLQNPTTTFAVIEPGGNEVTLQVCDSTGYCCSGSKKVNITLSLPEYREVPPVIWLKKFLAMVSDFLNGFLKFQ